MIKIGDDKTHHPHPYLHVQNDTLVFTLDKTQHIHPNNTL